MTDAFDDKDGVAAEYVLGTLDADPRAQVRARLAVDGELADHVKAWTRRLAPLDEATPPAVPSPAVWQRIEAALDGAPVVTAPARQPPARLWHGVGFWRWCTAGAVAVAAALALFVALPGPDRAPPARLVATLQTGGAAPAWLVAIEADRRRLRIEPVAAVAVPADRSLELWLIVAGAPAPRSLGVLAPAGATTLALTGPLAAAVGPRATLAISREPAGGSPTGTPTGPVVYQGQLFDLHPSN